MLEIRRWPKLPPQARKSYRSPATPHRSPNFLIDAYDVIVNRPKTAAYRAPGASNAAFATETIIDELAERCGIDRIEYNAIGARMKELPMSPPRILKALLEHRALEQGMQNAAAD